VPHALRVASFTSYTAIQQAVDGGGLPNGTSYVLYDNEHWSLTPADEQRQPATFAQQARALLHRHGLRLIFAPAVNLATVLAGVGANQKYASYLSLGLAADGARASDVFEIQAQQAIGTPTFDTFVTAAAVQARAANPPAPILVGLSTNPVGRPVTASDLLSAYRSTRTQVSGYWLNVPGSNAQCPSCGSAQPQVAVAFLQAVAAGAAG
jgi:hypothetical protein